MSKFFFDGPANNNNERGQGKVGGGQKSLKMGTKGSPAQISVQTEARQTEIEAIFAENKWVADIVVNADKKENIKDLEFLKSSEVVSVKTVNIGRNDPCTCGSGKKYKKCCGAA